MIGHEISLTAMIIDDNFLFTQILQEQIEEVSKEFGLRIDIEIATDPLRCLEQKMIFDLYFIDVEMPQLSGIDLVRKLREKYINAEFIFVSAYDQYIRPSILVRPSAFIRKSYLRKDLEETFYYLQRDFMKKNTVIRIKDYQKDILIKPRQIMYLQSEGHYVNIFDSKNGNILVRNSLKVLEKQLEPFDYLRIHLRYLINLNYVDGYDRTVVNMMNGKHLSISTPYMKNVSEKIMNWMLNRRE